VVYHARQHHPIARDVAVKIFHGAQSSPARLARIELERRALAALNHPGIAQVYDAGVAGDGTPYTVVEFVPGALPVTTYARLHRLGWRTRVSLVQAACEAVHHAHQRGVIHRDLKPANLLVFGDPSCPTLKLVDMGTARLLHESPGSSPHEARLVGTVAYMSPEQLRGDDVPDVRGDVYALGLLLHELLSGRPRLALNGEPLARALARVGIRPLPDLAEPVGSSGSDLSAICRMATAPDPAGRYRSAMVLYDELARVLVREPVLARPLSLRELTARRLRRHWRQATAAALAVVACAGTTLWALHSRRAAHSRQEQLSSTLATISRGVLEEIADLAGATAPRRELAMSLLGPLEGLLASDPGDRRALECLAAVRSELGNAEYQAGALEASLRHREAARAIFDRLYHDDPEDIATIRRFAAAIVKIGNIHQERASALVPSADDPTARPLWDAVHHAYERAQSLQLEALELHPEHAGVLDDLCFSYSRLAELARLRGDADEADKILRRRLELARDLFEREPNTPERRYGLSNATTQLASLDYERGCHKEAIELLCASLPIARALADEFPNDTHFVNEYLYAAVVLCRSHESAGESDLAMALTEEVLPITARQVRENPGRKDLVWCADHFSQRMPERWQELLTAPSRRRIRTPSESR
jgi:tetratricopeptide (TPR) repeat protein